MHVYLVWCKHKRLCRRFWEFYVLSLCYRQGLGGCTFTIFYYNTLTLADYILSELRNLFDSLSLIPSPASKHEHMMSKHALIGCQTWHDWPSNIWSLTDRNANFCTQNVHHQKIWAKPIYFQFMVIIEVKPLSWKGYAYWHRSGSIPLKKSPMSILFTILCTELLAQKFTPWSAKLQIMFDYQSCHVRHPIIRAFFNVTCSRLDASYRNFAVRQVDSVFTYPTSKWSFLGKCLNGPVSIYLNSNLAPRLRGITQKKSHPGLGMWM